MSHNHTNRLTFKQRFECLKFLEKHLESDAKKFRSRIHAAKTLTKAHGYEVTPSNIDGLIKDLDVDRYALINSASGGGKREMELINNRFDTVSEEVSKCNNCIESLIKRIDDLEQITNSQEIRLDAIDQQN